MPHLLCFLALLPLAAAHAAPPDDTWMSVLLDGRKIGSMHTTRSVDGERVRTMQAMQIELERSGLKVALSTSESDEETREGKPLRFESRTKISGIENVQTGTIGADGKLEVTTEVGGAKQSRTLAWPPGALLAEGLRLTEEKHGFTPGTRYKTLAFQAENLEAVEVDSRVGARETIDLPDGKRELVRIEQTIALGDAPTKTVSWVEADSSVRKLLVPMMGYELTMLACSKACATGPNQASDILVGTMLAAPRALTADERTKGMRILVSATDTSGEALKFATTDEQQIAAVAGGKVELRIAPASTETSREGKPTAADTQPNDWLQSAAPEIIKLAREGAGAAKAPAAQMQNLEDFVRRFIRTKDLSVGYASALEVAKNPEGDCTEHAVLLAALGRAIGIPTRVVDGLVYIDHYAGKSNVFVPHAWAQAWVDGHWRSYDAALQGFDAGHVALSTGSGDPWRFYAGFSTLGRARVEAIEPLQP
ncbi:transglutaminase-like domain-containing protein [Rudaea sp.]|uniref:transglutaminase-like domain-containing protein n=1 Tax=Rudaea sp. TaxID=2136325 RepID=UPI002ED02394